MITIASIVPIVITILKYKEQYLFIKRVKPPYENLWSLVGGKVDSGEHIAMAAIREIREETGASKINNYSIRGFVSERLIDKDSTLLSQFLIFVGYAEIESFSSENREGNLSLFTLDEIESHSQEFLPSDLNMFACFHELPLEHIFYEAELLYDGMYHLNYFRRS